MKYSHCVFQLAGLILGGLALTSCGSGGSSDGGTTPPIASPTQTTVSGTVQAPGGQIALFAKPSFIYRFANLFISEGYASMTGLSPVLNGTVVQLGRIGQTAPFVFTPITSTSISGGRYSFNLTNLGLSFANDLVVRVANGPVQMRAFVTGSTVDLNPVSETSVLLALQQLGRQPLNHLTIQEITDITGAVNIVASLSDGAMGNVQQTIDALKTLVVANRNLTAFIAAAAAAGQTVQAVGDIGNFFPFSQGNFWEFRKTRSSIGAPQVYTNTLSIAGTRGINGADTLVSKESNPENNGIAEEEYLVKTITEISIHGSQPADAITPQIVPYQAIRFPLSAFSKFVSLNKIRITISGIPVDLTVEVDVADFESVTVPSGTYPKALKVVTTRVATLAGDSAPIATGTQTTWFVSNIGPVKSVVATSDQASIETDTEELSRATIDGVEHVAGAQVRRVVLMANDLAYDRLTGKIFASVPGTPGSISRINPVTAVVETSITVGNLPNRLALSDDGRNLFVSLDGESAIRRVDLSTFSAQETFPLGTSSVPGCGTLSVSDMTVLPTNPNLLVVSKKWGCSPQFYEVAVYDRGVQRPNVIPRTLPGVISVLIDYIEPSASPSTVFGASASGPENFFIITVGSDGLSLSHRSQVLSFGPQDMKADSEFLFSGTGQKLDPATKAIVGQVQGLSTIPTVGSTRVRPDLSAQRLFYLPSEIVSGMPIKLQAYDSSFFQHIGTSQVHDGISGCPGCTFAVQGFIRWGARGLAFSTSNGQVVVIESAFFQ